MGARTSASMILAAITAASTLATAVVPAGIIGPAHGAPSVSATTATHSSPIVVDTPRVVVACNQSLGRPVRLAHIAPDIEVTRIGVTGLPQGITAAWDAAGRAITIAGTEGLGTTHVYDLIVAVTTEDNTTHTAHAAMSVVCPIDINRPIPTRVNHPLALSPEERQAVIRAVAAANPSIRKDSITVDEAGTVRVVIDGITAATLAPSTTIAPVGAPARITLPTRVLVRHADRLTAHERDRVAAAIAAANPPLSPRDIAVETTGRATIAHNPYYTPETIAGTDLVEADLDGDGIPDAKDTDADGDGISNADEEASNGEFDPRNPDTNGDGIADGDEDPDHDGVKSRYESLFSSKPAGSTDDEGLGTAAITDLNRNGVADFIDSVVQSKPQSPTSQAAEYSATYPTITLTMGTTTIVRPTFTNSRGIPVTIPEDATFATFSKAFSDDDPRKKAFSTFDVNRASGKLTILASPLAAPGNYSLPVQVTYADGSTEIMWARTVIPRDAARAAVSSTPVEVSSSQIDQAALFMAGAAVAVGLTSPSARVVDLSQLVGMAQTVITTWLCGLVDALPQRVFDAAGSSRHTCSAWHGTPLLEHNEVHNEAVSAHKAM